MLTCRFFHLFMNNNPEVPKNDSPGDSKNSKETSEYGNLSSGVTGSTDEAGNVYPLNPDRGDFLGKDKTILGKYNVSIGEGAEIHIGDKTFSSVSIVDIAADQLEHIRGQLIRLIPTKEALLSLNKLRQPTPISESLKGKNKNKTTLKASFNFWGMGGVEMIKELDESEEVNEEFLDELQNIQSQLSPSIEPEKLPQLQNDLRLIADKINIEISRFQSIFISFLYPATTCSDFIGNMVSKIGHQELQEEAQMHLETVKQLVRLLDSRSLSKVDILGNEAKIAIGVMYEIEQRRIIVEELVNLDRRKKNRTVATVIFYLLAIIALMAVLFFLASVRVQVGQQSLEDLRLPLFGIPWPIVLWSFVGSFAAMIYRFNRKPIYDFGDAVKWMITRPFQGVVLGSTFYLVLVSGLFLLTGNDVSDGSDSVRVDEIVLVLCFLVGFSDKFADTVFNTLVEKYSGNQGNESQGESDN